MKARATGRRTSGPTAKRLTRLMLSTGLLIGATGTVGLVATSAPATASNSPITIAYITSVTGEGASEDGTSPGAFKARIDLQNAEGGVNGHKIIPLIIDDQTSPTAIATAVQDADSKAFAIVSQSPLLFLAAKYPQQAGVPVTGSYSDGPEWGEQPYTNMFAADVGQPQSQVPGDHVGRELPEATRGQGARHLWIRDFAVFQPCRNPNGRFVQACRRQGRRARHDRSFRGS